MHTLHTRMHTHIHTHPHVHTNTEHMHTHTYRHSRAHTNKLHTRTHALSHTYATHTHTHTLSYTYTRHTHACMHRLNTHALTSMHIIIGQLHICIFSKLTLICSHCLYLGVVGLLISRTKSVVKAFYVLDWSRIWCDQTLIGVCGHLQFQDWGKFSSAGTNGFWQST